MSQFSLPKTLIILTGISLKTLPGAACISPQVHLQPLVLLEDNQSQKQVSDNPVLSPPAPPPAPRLQARTAKHWSPVPSPHLLPHAVYPATHQLLLYNRSQPRASRTPTTHHLTRRTSPTICPTRPTPPKSPSPTFLPPTPPRPPATADPATRLQTISHHQQATTRGTPSLVHTPRRTRARLPWACLVARPRTSPLPISAPTPRPRVALATHTTGVRRS